MLSRSTPEFFVRIVLSLPRNLVSFFILMAAATVAGHLRMPMLSPWTLAYRTAVQYSNGELQKKTDGFVLLFREVTRE